jgi:hypothetical protein
MDPAWRRARARAGSGGNLWTTRFRAVLRPQENGRVTEQSEDKPPRRAWYQRLPVLLLVGVLPVPFGLYFLAFIAMALLLSDRTRDTPVRAGGAVALFWWAYTWRQGDTTPFVGGPLAAVAAGLYAQAAWQRRTERARAAVRAACAVGLAVLTVVAFVPDGYRPAEVTREQALGRVLAERTARPWRGIDAQRYLVERGRARLVHTPLWYVVLYEPNPTVARTVDGEECLRRREVWRVDALDGGVSRVTYDEAEVADDPCLPVRAGTSRDLKPVPA